MVEATDYNEAEYQLSTRKVPEKYQLHVTEHNFKASLKTPSQRERERDGEQSSC